MGLIETAVLEALAEAGIALDATQVAERASVTPADADAALSRLVRKGLVRAVTEPTPTQRTRYLPA